MIAYVIEIENSLIFKLMNFKILSQRAKFSSVYLNHVGNIAHNVKW